MCWRWTPPAAVWLEAASDGHRTILRPGARCVEPDGADRPWLCSPVSIRTVRIGPYARSGRVTRRWLAGRQAPCRYRTPGPLVQQGGVDALQTAVPVAQSPVRARHPRPEFCGVVRSGGGDGRFRRGRPDRPPGTLGAMAGRGGPRRAAGRFHDARFLCGGDRADRPDALRAGAAVPQPCHDGQAGGDARRPFRGRVILPVGTGYLRSEASALGTDLAERNELFDEAVAAMASMWGGEDVSFHGRHFDAVGITARPASGPMAGAAVVDRWNGSARARPADVGDGWTPILQDEVQAQTTRTPPLPTACRPGRSRTCNSAAAAGRNRSSIVVQVQGGGGRLLKEGQPTRAQPVMARRAGGGRCRTGRSWRCHRRPGRRWMGWPGSATR